MDDAVLIEGGERSHHRIGARSDDHGVGGNARGEIPRRTDRRRSLGAAVRSEALAVKVAAPGGP